MKECSEATREGGRGERHGKELDAGALGATTQVCLSSLARRLLWRDCRASEGEPLLKKVLEVHMAPKQLSERFLGRGTRDEHQDFADDVVHM